MLTLFPSKLQFVHFDLGSHLSQLSVRPALMQHFYKGRKTTKGVKLIQFVPLMSVSIGFPQLIGTKTFSWRNQILEKLLKRNTGHWTLDTGHWTLERDKSGISNPKSLVEASAIGWCILWCLGLGRNMACGSWWKTIWTFWGSFWQAGHIFTTINMLFLIILVYSPIFSLSRHFQVSFLEKFCELAVRSF